MIKGCHGSCRAAFRCFSAVVINRSYFFAGATGVVAAGAATAVLAAAPALARASEVAFLASAAFLATPATLRQYALSTLPLASTLVGTIQPHAVASVLQDASSRPLQTTGATLGATVVFAAGAAGAAALGAAGATGAVVVVWADAANVINASEPANAATLMLQVEVFITTVVSSGCCLNPRRTPE